MDVSTTDGWYPQWIDGIHNGWMDVCIHHVWMYPPRMGGPNVIVKKKI